MDESELYKTHMSNLISFLSRKPDMSDGTKIVRNALLIKLHEGKSLKGSSNFPKSINTMCVHCFAPWKDGNFLVKYKPKNCSRTSVKKIAPKRMIIKCTNCSHAEYVPYIREVRTSDERRTKRKISIIEPKIQKKKLQNFKIKLISKQRKKPVTKKCMNTKSNLTILEDLL